MTEWYIHYYMQFCSCRLWEREWQMRAVRILMSGKVKKQTRFPVDCHRWWGTTCNFKHRCPIITGSASPSLNNVPNCLDCIACTLEMDCGENPCNNPPPPPRFTYNTKRSPGKYKAIIAGFAFTPTTGFNNTKFITFQRERAQQVMGEMMGAIRNHRRGHCQAMTRAIPQLCSQAWHVHSTQPNW